MVGNKQKPPFRAEHLGSLLRPKELTERRLQLDNAKALEIAHDQKLHEIEDKAINDIVKLQLDLGFHAINDGEYRRHQFWGTFFPNLEGFEEIDVPDWSMFRMYVPDIAAFSKLSPSSIQRQPLAPSRYIPCRVGSHVLITHVHLQPSPAISQASPSSALVRLSTLAAAIFQTGTISRILSLPTALKSSR
jgi:hypothetical protein